MTDPQEITRMLALLEEGERAVLRFRFGLDDGEMHTLDESARRFDVTRAQVRAFEARAMALLRHPPPG